MRKIFIPILILIAFIAHSQTPVNYNPGRSVMVSNLAIAGIGGADTSFKFVLPPGCTAYSIEILQIDTIETVATGAWLYGSNDGGNWVTIGDTLVLAKDAATQVDYFTGTTFPYYMGKVRIPKYTVSDGDISIILYYYK